MMQLLELLGAAAGMLLPTARQGLTAGAEPAGWLLCDGRAVNRVAYPGLFAAIGVGFGGGDGSTTFNLPDLRGRTPVGAGQGVGLTNRVLADEGGEEAHQLTANELPAHQHFTVNEVAGGVAGISISGSTSPSVANATDADYELHNQAAAATRNPSSPIGADAAHNNMPPFVAISYLIKT